MMYKHKKKRKQKRLLLSAVIAVCLLFAVTVVLLLLPSGDASEIASPLPAISSILPPAQPKIEKGITISGIPVGKLTEEDALRKLQTEMPREFEQTDFTLLFGDDRVVVSHSVMAAHWDFQSALSTAMKGKSCDLDLIIDRDAVRTELSRLLSTMGGVYAASGYWLEGEMPDLLDADGKCQTLVVRKGATGREVDIDDLLLQIKAAVQAGQMELHLPALGDIKTPSELDVEEMYRLLHVDAVNPSLDKATMEPVPGVPGYGFDKDFVGTRLENAMPGETLRIEMQYIEPEISLEEAWFLDVLGYCKTEHSDEENRNTNLRLACDAINGTILQPGESLSYNQKLGKRTTEAGYKPAPAYSGTELINEIGGGICQVSSTLYLSSLFAELTIVERKNHGFPTNYLPLGLDATVNWGTTDLKIRNDYEYPVKIVAEVDDLYVRVKIMGVDLRDYYVKMEYRVDAHPSYASAYRCRYDRETDEEIFRQLDHTSPYLEEVWCYPGYAENATDEP